MITIMIAQNETRVKELILQLLEQKGYTISTEARSGMIEALTMGKTRSLETLEDKIVETEKSLYNEKKGAIYKAILEKVERPIIEYALERTEGNQLKAARVLGINRNTMRAKIKKLGIDADKWKI